MSGGILAWNGEKAAGDETLGLEYFIQGEFNSVFSMAYAMEQGLQQFYQLLADRADEPSCRELLTRMAKLEDGHMAKLAAQYPGLSSQHREMSHGTVVEGGIDSEEFLERFGDQMTSIERILHVGMMFETQAYDLYSRLARKNENQEIREFFVKMASEEKSHLGRLTKELEDRLPPAV